MRRPPKLQLAAGVVDAAVASVATFAAGLTAVRLLSDVDLGIYGIFFAAFFLGSVIVTELVLVPAQVVAVNLPEEHRLGITRKSIILGLAPAIAGTLAAATAALLTNDLTSGSVIKALALTAAATIVVSPMQDHVRQLLHIANRSWHAASVSIVQLAGVIVAIVVLVGLDVDRAWVPFGSLASANILSLITGLALTGALRRNAATVPLSFGELVASGKWLVIRASTPAAFAFLAAYILTELAGPEAYGYAEAARQVAQPITVLSVGLMAVLGPRAVRAGSEFDAVAGAHNRRSFMGLMVLGSVAYALVAGFDWALNPMAWLVPPAFTVGGLVLVTILANLIASVFLIYGRELLGAGQARSLAIISIAATPALPLAAATAGSTEAFARPLGYIAEGLIRIVGVDRWLRHHYRSGMARFKTSNPDGSGLESK